VRIDEILNRGDGPVFSFEFFPPKTPEGERNLYNALTELRPLEPAYVSVTYGAGGSTRDKTLEIVQRIKEEFDLEAMAHFTCVEQTVEEIEATLQRMRAAGIDNVLALRGDPPAGQAEWTKTEGGLEFSHELVRLIRDSHEFSVGAACFPETHIHATSPDDDLRYLKEKVDAGVDFLITQMFFHNDLYFDFVERARAIGIDVPIIPGIWPITNVAQIKKVTELCAATIRPELLAELEARASEPEAALDFGVAYATLQSAELLREGAPGIHFYTLNRSPATRAILGALKLPRPWLLGSSSISSASATRGEPSGAS
jgi:methylenetetrahydrofolate reductase (NADPH)